MSEAAEYKNIHKTLSSLSLSYDPETGYKYAFPDGNAIIMTVPNGASTDRPVELKNVAELLIVTVSKDGEDILFDADGIYDEPGKYTVSLKSLTVSETEHAVTEYDASLRFSVSGKYRTETADIRAPENMVIRTVRLNDRILLSEKNVSHMVLSDDGNYSVEYVNKDDPAVSYTEEFILDTNAPVLTFSKDITASRIFAPVTVRCDEQDVTVTVIKDGIEYPLTESGITGGGAYIVRAEDPAGNTTDYSFFVRYGKHVPGTVFIAFFAVLFLALLFQMIFLRKHRSIR